MPGPARLELDYDDREISTKVSGEKVPRHSSGPSRIESL